MQQQVTIILLLERFSWLRPCPWHSPSLRNSAAGMEQTRLSKVSTSPVIWLECMITSSFPFHEYPLVYALMQGGRQVFWWLNWETLGQQSGGVTKNIRTLPTVGWNLLLSIISSDISLLFSRIVPTYVNDFSSKPFTSGTDVKRSSPGYVSFAAEIWLAQLS